MRAPGEGASAGRADRGGGLQRSGVQHWSAALRCSTAGCSAAERSTGVQHWGAAEWVGLQNLGQNTRQNI